MTEPWSSVVVAGLFGLILGSFLNVCAWRWPRSESVVSPRSRCPGCETPLIWNDNIPVISWLLLRGRCRTCQDPISVQYPLVELATGLVWAGMVYHEGVVFEAVRGGLFLTVLLGIALTDAREYIIPDEFSVGGAVLGFGASFMPGGIGWEQSLLGAAVGFFLLWGVAIVGKIAFKKEAMGGGDIKMMALIGSFLGVAGVLLTLFLGALLGSVVFGPISWKTGKLVPFGIFLSLGAALTYVWGPDFLEWYSTAILGMARVS